jgi:hypothetical protein
LVVASSGSPQVEPSARISCTHSRNKNSYSYAAVKLFCGADVTFVVSLNFIISSALNSVLPTALNTGIKPDDLRLFSLWSYFWSYRGTVG